MRPAELGGLDHLARLHLVGGFEGDGRGGNRVWGWLACDLFTARGGQQGAAGQERNAEGQRRNGYGKFVLHKTAF